MIQAKSISFPKQNHTWFLVPLALSYLLFALLGLKDYLLWQSLNFMLGVLAMLMVTKTDSAQKGNFRYAFGSLVFALLSCWLPLKTLFFISILFAVFFLIENYFGRLNFLPLMVAGMMSPFFQYITGVFSFPIRLELTRWAGAILHSFGVKVKVLGSIITCRAQEFTVDSSCMGLNMMIASLMLCAVLLAIVQRRSGKIIGPWMGICFFLFVIALNIISNLIRIVCLIQFAILPSSVFHELTGLICLVVYVIIPATLLVKWIVCKWGRAQQYKQSVPGERNPLLHKILHLAILSLLCVNMYNLQAREKNRSINNTAVPIIPGYTATPLADGVVKLDHQQSLVYLKPIPDFFNPDHNPSICWKGSGYRFEQIREEVLWGHTVYTAALTRESDTLYTAWWYSNGSTITVSQVKFRWDIISGGDKYTLVNVTAAGRNELEQELRAIFEDQRFDSIIRNNK